MSDEILYDTLEHVFFDRFAPGLFEAVPQLLSENTLFSVAGPYALRKVQAMLGRADETDEGERRMMERMVALWGNGSAL